MSVFEVRSLPRGTFAVSPDRLLTFPATKGRPLAPWRISVKLQRLSDAQDILAKPAMN